MTVIVISLVFAGIVGVLWIGARDVRADAMSVGRARAVRHLRGAWSPARVAALSEIWGELQRAAGATERLVELLNAADAVQRPGRARCRCRARSPARVTFDDVVFRYPARPEVAALDGVSLRHPARARRWRWSAPRARARRRSSSFCCGSTTRSRARSGSTGVRPARHGAGGLPPARRAGAAGPGDLRRPPRARTSASAGPAPATPRSRRPPAPPPRTTS